MGEGATVCGVPLTGSDRRHRALMHLSAASSRGGAAVKPEHHAGPRSIA
jgi:hypothetical protein